MKYKILGNNNYRDDIQAEFFKNKGIDDPSDFFNLKDVKETHYSDFKNMDTAIECFQKHKENGSEILIIVDADCDGISSTTIIHNYLVENNVIPKENISISIHEDKTHGIIISEIEQYLDSVKLIIVPDAGSGDFEEHKILADKGIDIIVLDHHECEKYSQNAIVVNNQMSGIALNFCGGAMCYKFIQGLDKEYGINTSEKYLDLVTLALVADMMDVRTPEVQLLMSIGLDNILNPMLEQMFIAQSYSTKGAVNQITISFYIAPLINAVIRIGTMEDKTILMEAFTNQRIDEIFPYTPTRGKNKGITKDESIYEHAVRMCQRLRGKQNRTIEKALNGSKRPRKIGLIEFSVTPQEENKILVLDATEFIQDGDEGTTGLIANKIMYKHNKPTLVFTKNEKGTYSGSGRAIQIEDFREKLSKVDGVIKAEGHEFAFGLEVEFDDVHILTNAVNDFFKDEEFEVCHYVDFAIPSEEFDEYIIEDLHQLENFFGKGIDTPLLYVYNVRVNNKNIEVLDNGRTVKFIDENDINYIVFDAGIRIEEFNSWKEDLTFDIVGKPSIGEYKGERYVQLIVEDFQILKEEQEEDDFDWDSDLDWEIDSNEKEDKEEDFEW